MNQDSLRHLVRFVQNPSITNLVPLFSEWWWHKLKYNILAYAGSCFVPEIGRTMIVAKFGKCFVLYIGIVFCSM